MAHLVAHPRSRNSTLARNKKKGERERERGRGERASDSETHPARSKGEKGGEEVEEVEEGMR
jgi:hypothetical protein